ncbi:MAG: SulP family inorganic anion transporter [Flavobacteriaceae bacterium]
MIMRYLPILEWLPHYKKEYFKGDLAAGLTVGVLLIPQGMAYALIAGLPPVYGLYAALVPQVVYAVLGTSRQLAVGPVALDSLLVAAGLGSLSLSGPEEYILLAISLSFMVGLLQIAMGFLQMGFVVAFLSKPVISGFTSAAAIIIGLSQIKYFLGINILQSNQIQKIVVATISSFNQINYYSLLLGITALVLLHLLKKFYPKIPSVILVVLLSILFSKFFKWENQSIELVGSIPAGLPHFEIPQISAIRLSELFSIALTLALVAYLEAISLGKAFEEKNKTQYLNPNQELIALGGSNLVGAFFQSYPITGGFSRTAVNDQAGAKSGVALLISALVVGCILLFLTPWFYYLPKTILAAIIIRAVSRLVDINYAAKLFRNHKEEFFILLFTFLATLFLGIKEGVLLGVLFSLLHLVYRTSKPHFAILGKIKDTPYFRNIKRFPEMAVVREDLLIIRFDGQLYFGNIQYFKTLVEEEIQKKQTTIKGFVLNAEAIHYIDATATSQLITLFESLQQKGIRVLIAGAIGPTRDRIFKSKLIDTLKAKNLFINTEDAVQNFDGFKDKSTLKKNIRRQNNSSIE